MMEIAPAPPRRRLSTRARVLLMVAIFAPVTFLALVPTAFGLERYVVASDSMDGSVDRGSVVFERVVPVSDLEPGDVVTYEPPASAGVDGLVTHRIVWVDGSKLQTQGDANAEPDPWLVPLSEPTMSRVVVAVPYVGYPFVAPVGQAVWFALLVVPGIALIGLLAQDAQRHRGRRGRPSGTIGTPMR